MKKSAKSGHRFLNFKIFLEVSISLEVPLYCAQTAGKPDIREPTLSFLNVGMSRGSPRPAWHLSVSVDWGKVVLLGKGLVKPWGAGEASGLALPVAGRCSRWRPCDPAQGGLTLSTQPETSGPKP